MDHIKVLVADDNASLRSRISEALISRPEVDFCDGAPNGLQAFSMLQEKSYDILICDLILPQMDGFVLLEEAQKFPRPPKVIIISALSQDELIRKVCSLGAYFYIMKPFDLESLCRRVVEAFDAPLPVSETEPLVQLPRPQRAVKSLDERIANVFLAVGIPAHIKGYHFLREAVRLVYHDRSMINAITKELYPGVAMAFETSPSKVERAIRHAIEVAWARGKIENINGIFGYTIYTKQEKPTNGEIIALVADKLLMDDLTRNEQQTYAG